MAKTQASLPASLRPSEVASIKPATKAEQVESPEDMLDSVLEGYVREFFLRRLRERPNANLREFRGGIMRSFNNLPESARIARRSVVLHCQATPQTIEVLGELLGVVCP